MAVLLIIGIGLIVLVLVLNSSADKSEQRFNNRPAVINDPAKDLPLNQKYAIVRLFAIVQGCSVSSAYDQEASQIVMSTIFSMGLSREKVERILRITANRDPEAEISQIFDCLSEIKDKDYLRRIYQKCRRIAVISGDNDMIEGVDNLFHKL